MNDEHKIIQQVYAAKEDMEAADRLIGAYMPFIKAETAKFLKRPPMEGHDDELSIAMIAFHEAIRGYSRSRGAFLKISTVSSFIRSAAISKWNCVRQSSEAINSISSAALFLSALKVLSVSFTTLTPCLAKSDSSALTVSISLKRTLCTVDERQ